MGLWTQHWPQLGLDWDKMTPLWSQQLGSPTDRSVDKERQLGGGDLRKWMRLKSVNTLKENYLFYSTLLMIGNSVQTTWTSSGDRPISSSASLRAVSTSSWSLGSLFPPGKHTSPALVLSYKETNINRIDLQDGWRQWPRESIQLSVISAATRWEEGYILDRSVTGLRRHNHLHSHSHLTAI